MQELSEWNSFYVIVGASAGGLIGLQFVVMTLIADMPALRAEEGGNAFATPSVVHFGVVLFLSAVVSAPWHSIGIVAVFWGLTGVGGVLYTIVVLRRMQTQKVYKPVFEDWLFYGLLPTAAYAVLTVATFVAFSSVTAGLFIVAGVTLVFLFVGIHNAWDSVTYLVFVHRGDKKKIDD